MRLLHPLLLLTLASCVASRPPTPPVTPTASPTPTSTASPTPTAPLPDPHVARLARLARIWGDVQYLHPYLWEDRKIDWDAALSAAIPKTTAATTDDEEVAAIQSMLDALHDPATRVEATSQPARTGPRAETSTKWPTPDVLVLKLALHEWGEMARRAPELTKEIAKAKALVLDLRAIDSKESWRARAELDGLAGAIVPHECAVPATRSVLHSGYRPQSGESSGGYSTSFVSEAPQVYPAAKGAHPSRLVVLVNEQSVVPDLALAMRRAGDAKIVAQGKMTDPARWSDETDPVVGGKLAFIRTVEIDADLAPDLVLPDATDVEGGAALDAAVMLAKRGWTSRPATATRTPPSARWRPDPTYPDEAYPPTEHRLLALFRFWNVIRLFYPYLPLLEPGAWDRALTDFIPHFEQARNAHEYALTLGELAAHVPDSHVGVDSTELRNFLGRSLYGVTLRRIEGQPVVTAVDDPAKESGLHVGDVVVSIDGEPFETRVARVRPYIAASNAWTLSRDADRLATAGAKDSEAVLHVRGDDAKEREVRVKRHPWSDPGPPKPPHYKAIDDGNVGYVDLSNLTPDEVDPMFEALGKTRAIVFDMRGYPNGTAWPIARHLNMHDTGSGPQIYRALVGGNGYPLMRFMFVQPVPNDDKPKYTGKTVMLINEVTQSQAEHTGLFFEAANGTKFIGSRSAGANGDVTSTCVPGNVCISFTGHDVRHADGRQLQRVGLQPDVDVRPTIAGVRAGRDEVLDRALQYLRDGS